MECPISTRGWVLKALFASPSRFGTREKILPFKHEISRFPINLRCCDPCRRRENWREVGRRYATKGDTPFGIPPTLRGGHLSPSGGLKEILSLRILVSSTSASPRSTTPRPLLRDLGFAFASLAGRYVNFAPIPKTKTEQNPTPLSPLPLRSSYPLK